MRPLLSFADSSAFRDFVTQLAALLSNFPEEHQGYVQGITIDLHPVWREAQVRTQYNLLGSSSGNPEAELILASSTEYEHYESDKFPDVQGWSEYAKQNNRDPSAPVVVRICVLPTTSSTLPSRRSLVTFASSQPFFTIVEDRPEAVLAANIEGGVETTANYDGTLGGFLDDNGSKYGFTCGHVATTKGQSVDVDDASAIRVVGAGIVDDSNFSKMPPNQTPAFCNPFNSTLPDIDVAMISLGSSHMPQNTVNRIGQIIDIKSKTKLWPGQAVAMRGARSGANQYTIGGLAVCYRFNHRGAYYCFRDLFEIRGRMPAALSPRLAQPMAPRAQQGDSGAWVCSLEQVAAGANQYAFCGTLTGVDLDIGFATFTDALISWSGKALKCF